MLLHPRVATGQNYDGAAAEADRIMQEEGLTLVHPFNDPDVIAGQGTIAMEILKQLADVDTVYICVGGGGMLAGIAGYIKGTTIMLSTQCFKLGLILRSTFHRVSLLTRPWALRWIHPKKRVAARDKARGGGSRRCCRHDGIACCGQRGDFAHGRHLRGRCCR